MSPTNPMVSALLTDLYQLTMTFAHFQAGKHEEQAVFELFFRKNPFQGEFTIFAGLDEVLKHLDSFSFSKEDIDYLRSTPSLKHAPDDFWEYLLGLDTSGLVVRSMKEGSIAFPRVPLLIIEGPLGLGQLLETTLLNLVNFPSLIATNAARMVLRAHPHKCIEFGLRRAQGPDGAMSASKYSYMGGFTATSNVQAGKFFGIPIAGTHAHSYVQSFASLDEVKNMRVYHKHKQNDEYLLPTVLKYREKLEALTSNDGELASFCAYACAFPDSCLCLIDTYDTLSSGLLNFTSVALALDDFGYTAKGIRLDSGDLCHLSLECQRHFEETAAAFNRPTLRKLSIVASNDINEDTLQDLREKSSHGITVFGIGTNLVTCQKQPALGCVYKLVEWKGQPRIKLSQDLPKMTIPGKKKIYRFYGSNGQMMLDLMTLATEKPPVPNSKCLCRNPFSNYRCMAIPSRVDELHKCQFADGSANEEPRLEDSKSIVSTQLELLEDKVKAYHSPIPYPIFVSQQLSDYLHMVWEDEAPIKEMR